MHINNVTMGNGGPASIEAGILIQSLVTVSTETVSVNKPKFLV